jgi:hypothetical protein
MREHEKHVLIVFSNFFNFIYFGADVLYLHNYVEKEDRQIWGYEFNSFPFKDIVY